MTLCDIFRKNVADMSSSRQTVTIVQAFGRQPRDAAFATKDKDERGGG